MLYGSCAEPFGRFKVPAKGKRQGVEDEDDGHGDAAGDESREAGNGAYTYSNSKTTIRKYDIPYVVSGMTVVY